jgi:serine/threonine protein kinase/tetratricopeptide (TPR) repeat protein
MDDAMAHVSTNTPNLQRLGDFEIVREIGRGGMGVVYEARQVSLNRKVALKVLSGGLGLTPKAVQRFRREAEAAAKLHHTNIVPVYATGEEDGTHFYAMELIEGPSLDHVIRQMRMGVGGAERSDAPAGASETSAPATHLSPDLVQTGPYVEGANIVGASSGPSSSSLGSGGGYFDTVARMIAEVADALDYAHSDGVVHRDMKPSNLLLSPAGRLSVNDFGLARMLEQPGMTMTGEFVGTPAYMSPEQITAGRTPLDQRTDIYSLGATLYELLTLQPPFMGERRDQVLAQILHKEPKSPRKVNPKVPVDLETICLKAMEKDPDRRYQTAGAMAEDLRRYVNRFAISARRAGPTERLRKWIKRHPGLTAGVLLALIGISLAGFFGIQAWRDRQERIAAAAKARQEKLHDKQQKVVHDILMGDFKAAEKAISEAEGLGASEEWVQWRRGQIAFHNGEWEEAIQLLEPAAIEMPDSLALNWLLALVYRLNGDDDRFAEIAERIDSLPACTEEEFIYKGFALTPYAPKQSLALFDEAIKARGSLVAFGLRAMCRIRLAFNKNDLSILKPAMDDAAAAKSIMSDNPLAHVNSLIVHYSASILYEQGKKTKESEEALRIATEEANALEAFPIIPLAVNVRGIFLADLGKNEEAIQWFEMCTKHKKLARGPTDHYAWQLYERGEADKALHIIEQVAPRGRMSFSRGIFAAEAKNGGLDRALKICDEMEAERSVEGRFRRLALLFFLGQKKKALDLFGKYPPKLGHRASDKLYERVASYWKDPTADEEKQLLDFASGSKASLVYAHWYIAFRLIGDGDREGARRHFKACMALHFPYFLGYLESRALLARMDKDLTWPRWIPPKQDQPKQ